MTPLPLLVGRTVLAIWKGAQWIIGRVFTHRPLSWCVFFTILTRDRGDGIDESHRRHCVVSFTHLNRMEFPTVINWTSPFPFKGAMNGNFHFYSNFNRTICEQTVETLIRRRVVRRLIWICTVCQCHTKRTLGLNGLSKTHESLLSTGSTQEGLSRHN